MLLLLQEDKFKLKRFLNCKGSLILEQIQLLELTTQLITMIFKPNYNNYKMKKISSKNGF